MRTRNRAHSTVGSNNTVVTQLFADWTKSQVVDSQDFKIGTAWHGAGSWQSFVNQFGKSYLGGLRRSMLVEGGLDDLTWENRFAQADMTLVIDGCAEK